jgi:hypothetical protein
MRTLALAEGGTLYNPEDFKPGAFGLSVISGPVGKAVKWGQAVFAGDDGPYTHAWIILDKGQVIEAEPGGARIVSVNEYLKHDAIYICDAPVQELVKRQARRMDGGVLGDLSDAGAFWKYAEGLFRRNIVETARSFEGAPYGWLQYPYIGLAAAGHRWGWLRKAIGNKRVICSQLVDRVMQANEVQLFDDGRWEGEVTPGDLWTYASGT